MLARAKRGVSAVGFRVRGGGNGGLQKIASSGKTELKGLAQMNGFSSFKNLNLLYRSLCVFFFSFPLGCSLF